MTNLSVLSVEEQTKISWLEYHLKCSAENCEYATRYALYDVSIYVYAET